MARWLLLGLVVLGFGSFAWSIPHAFRRVDDHDRRWYRCLLGGTTIVAAATLRGVYRMDAGAPWTFVVGVVVSTGAIALFWSTVRHTRAQRLSLAFSGDVPTMLYETGPYAAFRHPFYLSYLATYAGYAIATGSAWILPGYAIIVVVYRAAAAREERKFRASPLAERYEAYCARIGFFGPTWRRP